TFTPADAVVYRAATASVSIDVLPIPTITWPPPAAIVEVTPLGPAQLNAAANVPGTFSYSPPAGMILPAGNGQLLTATFTPDDLATYRVGMATVAINVTAGPSTQPVIAWPKPAAINAGTPLGSAQLRASAN